MATQFLFAIDDSDDLVIEELSHSTRWTPPTDSFVCWADSPNGTPITAASPAGMLTA